MTTTRKILLGAFAALGLLGSSPAARANNWGCNGPMCNQPKYPSLGAFLFHGGGNKPPLPTFQAAPWYLYWPYDAHFQTPAPVNGPFYGAPGAGNFPVNPYFPAPAYAPYGPLPGGPPPQRYGAQAPAGYGGYPAPGYTGGYGVPPGYNGAAPQGYGPPAGYAGPQAPLPPQGPLAPPPPASVPVSTPR